MLLKVSARVRPEPADILAQFHKEVSVQNRKTLSMHLKYTRGLVASCCN